MPERRTASGPHSEQPFEVGKNALEQEMQETTAALYASEAALRESEVWLAAQKEAFKAALNGASLETSLGILARTAAEQWGAGTRCAFYMADAVHRAGL
jgi:hypothetical protein